MSTLLPRFLFFTCKKKQFSLTMLMQKQTLVIKIYLKFLTSSLSTSSFNVMQWSLFLWTSLSLCSKSFLSLSTSVPFWSLSCVILSKLFWSCMQCSLSFSLSLICLFSFLTRSSSWTVFFRLAKSTSPSPLVSCLLLCKSFFNSGTSNNISCNWSNCCFNSKSSFVFLANSPSNPLVFVALELEVPLGTFFVLDCSWNIQIPIQINQTVL